MYPTWYACAVASYARYTHAGMAFGFCHDRCTIFLGLLVGCSKPLPDGSSVLRAFPALNCEEIENRVLIGWSGTILICVGLPMACTVLALLHLERQFTSALSYFLVRSVFSGYNDSITGFGFKIFCMARLFFLVFIVTSPAWIGDTTQLIGLQALITTSLFVEGLTQPRTTAFMNILESVEEVRACLAMDGSGERGRGGRAGRGVSRYCVYARIVFFADGPLHVPPDRVFGHRLASAWVHPCSSAHKSCHACSCRSRRSKGVHSPVRSWTLRRIGGVHRAFAVFRCVSYSERPSDQSAVQSSMCLTAVVLSICPPPPNSNPRSAFD